VIIDRDKTAQLGLKMSDVGSSLSALLGGGFVNYFSMSGRSYKVIPQVQQRYRLNPQQLLDYYIRTADGTLVPLSTVASLTMVSARSLVEHEDGLRRQVVIASPTTADQAGYAHAAQAAIATHIRLPPNVYLRYGGTAPAQAAAAHELLWHSAAALILIVLLLALAWQASAAPDTRDLILAGAVVWWLAAFLWVAFVPRRVSPWSAGLAGVLALVPSWVAMVRLRLSHPHGAEWVLFALLLVWVADIGAFFVGRRFGRIRLAPEVSPGKTWEGALGGLAVSALVAVA